MKLVLLFSLVFSSSLTFARSLPHGRLKVIITQSDWIKHGDNYELKRSPLCTVIRNFQTEIPNSPIFKPEVAGTCKFIYKGNTFTATAFYLVMYKSDFELGPLVEFMSSVMVSPVDGDTSPFPDVRFGSASTRDLHIKNMIVRSEAMTECPNGGSMCMPDTVIDGSFDFEVQ
jgi:hypothetical protein